jgi:hypothetical protein
MSQLMLVHYLDVTGKSVTAPNVQPDDLGWGAVPGPLAPGSIIFINDQPKKILGFSYRTQTVPMPTRDAAAMAVDLPTPILEIIVCTPGQEPKITGLVGASAAALEGLGGPPFRRG